MSARPDISQFLDDADAKKVLQALAAGKWRKARDFAKELCKKDRPRYQALLIEANVGLARDLIARGLLSDAEPVLLHLKTIAPPELVAALEKDLAAPSGPMPQGQPGEGSGAAIVLLWPELLRIARRVEAGETLTDTEIITIDDVVTSYAPGPSGTDDVLSVRLGAELLALHSACAASAEARWEEASEVLRALPARSVFRHWRIFLRGMRQAALGETDSARESFARLPSRTACALAAVTLLGEEPVAGLRPAAQAAWWLACSGQPPEWASGIVAAETAWRKNDWGTTFRELSRVLGKSFPSDGSGLAAALKEALYWLPFAEGDLLFKSFNTFHNQLHRQDNLSSRQFLASLRPTVLVERRDMPTEDLRSQWGMVLALESELQGINAIRESQGWQLLGGWLAETEESFSFFGGAPRMRDAAGALKAYRDATKSDPENEEAWTGLLQMLERLKKKSEHHRILEAVVKRFPGNKSFLVHAGNLASQRKAPAKAVNFFQQALALDPLDNTIRGKLVTAYLLQVETALAKGKSPAEIWAQIEPLLDSSPSCTDYFRARWAMRVRRALLDPARADADRAEARQTAPSSLEFLAFEFLMAEHYGRPLPETGKADWALLSPDSWNEVNSLLRLDAFSEHLLPGRNKPSFPLDALFHQRISPSILGVEDWKKLLTADPLEAFAFFTALKKRGQQRGPGTLPRSLMLAFTNAVKQLKKPDLASSLHLRYLALEVDWRESPGLSLKSLQKRTCILLAEAKAAGDSALVEAAERLNDELIDEDFDEDFDIDFDEDFDDPIPDFEKDQPRRKKPTPRKKKKKAPKKKPASKKPVEKAPAPPPPPTSSSDQQTTWDFYAEAGAKNPD